ncbi:hypothetical protein L7F22_019467 [Adiantum nelumboides]|nr:hypothetical protein [Adiantum nelumboides]
MSDSFDRSSWRNRLGRALFGIHADSSEDLREGSSHVQTESCAKEEATPTEQETGKNPAQPISIADSNSGARPTRDVNATASSPIISGSSSSIAPSSQSTKKKNLQAMLSSSVEDAAKIGSMPQSVAKDRITVQPVAHRKSISSEDRNDKEMSSLPQASRGKVDIASSLGTSLSQGVKSLSERYTHSREASENFKSMRERNTDGGSSSPILGKDLSLGLQSSRRSSESLRRPETPNHHRKTSSASISKDSIFSDTIQNSSETNKNDEDERSEAVAIPEQLQKGEVMLKVTSRKVMQRVVRIDADAGQILWDSKKNNRVNLESIRELRSGSAARSYRTSLSIAAAHEQHWISIIYQANSIYKALHLIALSDESHDRWYNTLQAVQNERKLLASCVDMSERRQSIWLRQQFKDADTSKDARLDFGEIVRLCRRMGIMSNKEDLRKRFDEADKEGLGYLDFAKFQHFVAFLKRRVEVEEIFNRLADTNFSRAIIPLTPEAGKTIKTIERPPEVIKIISQTSFFAFLRDEQGHSEISQQAMTDTYRRFRTIVSSTEEGISYDGFLAFLMSSDNAILSDQSSLANNRAKDASHSSEEDPSNASRAHAETAEALIAISGQVRVTQDMNRPLPEYFISSSHNTYLVKGQLTGESTAEGYIRALMQGARSVELDCWDGPGNEPVVTHGHTLTSKVPFRDVIQAIGKYAFVASPYPLILSLEVHTDLVQQDAIAEILRTVLGDKLLQYPLEGHSDSILPSPQELIGKILVKAKNILLSKKTEEPDKFEMVMKDQILTSTTDTTTESESDGLLNNARELVRSVTQKGRKLSHKGKVAEKSTSNAAGEKKKVMSPALASLLIYTVGVKHRGINKKENYAIEHMISLSERTALKYARSSSNGGGHNWEDLIKHNRTHLTRIYPSMNTFARLSYSANFLPNIFWRLGCQLVALNWQTVDLGLEMNQAMFMRNGRSGYVLKPEALRKKEKYSLSDPLKDQPESTQKGTFVNVITTLISAQQLPRNRHGGSKKGNENDSQEREDDTTVLDPFISVAVIVPDTPSFNVLPSGSNKTSSTISSSNSLKSEKVDLNSSPALARASSLNSNSRPAPSPTSSSNSSNSLKTRKSLCRARTSTVWQNGFNPIWNETLSFRIRLPTKSSTESTDLRDSVRGLLDLCFIRFEVRNETKRDQIGAENQREQSGSSFQKNEANINQISSSTSSISSKSNQSGQTVEVDIADDIPCLATYMISLGALEQGYHHVPLYDTSMTQHLFSTLFVHTNLQIDE